MAAVGFVAAGPAAAAGPEGGPPRIRFPQFELGKNVIEGSNFTPGGPVAVYVYNASNPTFPLVGVARTVATRPFERCDPTGCRRYPGGEISVLVYVDQSSTCWKDLWTSAVDEAGGRVSGWIFAQHNCPWPGE